MSVSANLPQTLGALRSDPHYGKLGPRTVKDELRSNLICKLQKKEDLFPGIVGYQDTVVPQVVNAVLSQHNFILGAPGASFIRTLSPPCADAGISIIADCRTAG